MNIIVDEADRLTALVSSVMELSKVTSGTYKCERVHFDMGQLCDEVSERYDAICAQNGWQLQLELPEEELPVYADPDMMQRALHNLLGNAMHHIGQDGIFILRAFRCSEGVRVEVEDHGPGIAAADLPYIFDRYYRSRSDAGKQGTGLGLSITKAIFQQLSQNYLKFRNTAKFCLDNLTDFDPNQLTAPAGMEALDRWAITKLNELLVKCEAAYQNYEFLTVSHAVNDFCVVTLSSLYLDIIKDRLYCDGADSAARRSAQSALWIILDAMTKVFAPILAFTCDEIWLQMPHRNGDDGRNVLLNQMSKPYADYALSDAEMAVWETALRVRSDVNGVLETARADKRIGKSLEAHVALIAGDEDAKAALDAVKSVDLPEIFIVSNVSTNETAPAEGAVVGQGVNFPGLTVAVTEVKGTKCPRCWMHSESPDEHGLCPRCAAVCKALGVVFE